MTLIWGIQSAGNRRGNPRQPNLQEMLMLASQVMKAEDLPLNHPDMFK
jgi:hypothetical protein